MRKSNTYGSTDLQKSNERSHPDEIISQTYCKCSFIIEPVVFLQTIAGSIIAIAFGQFIYARILNRLIEHESIDMTNLTNSTKHFELSYTNDNGVCSLNSSSNDAIRIQAQKESAKFFFICSLFGGLPCIFSTNFFGVNCSKLGRKFLLILGLTIMTMRCIIFLLLAIYPTLPDYLFYICALIDGLSGSNGLFNLILHCYIADLTTTKNRSYRLTFINYIGSVSSLLISYTCGYVIKYLGYIYIFASSLFFYFLSLIYLVVFVPEPLIEVRKKCIWQRLKSCSIRRIKNSFNVLCRQKHPVIVNTDETDENDSLIIAADDNSQLKECGLVRQRCVIIFVVIANLVYCAAGAGVNSIFTLFIMNTPFCWDSVHISTFTLYTTIIHFISSVLVSRFLRVNDILTCIASAASYFATLFLYAFATNSLGIYIGSTAAAISGLEFGLARSFVSKLVTKHEVADALTFIACVDTLTSVMATIIFPFIYEKLVDSHLNILFFIAACFTLITITFHLMAYSIYKKPVPAPAPTTEKMNNEDESIDAASTQNYSDDNDKIIVTADPTQVDSISQFYNSIVTASHENANRSV